MRSHESRRLGEGTAIVSGDAAAKTRGSAAESARLKPISKPPASFTNSLRETVILGAMILCAPFRWLRRPANRGEDTDVASAPAHQSFKCFPHFGVAGTGIDVEERFGRHHPAVQAVAALEGLLRDERRLHGMRFPRGLQAFERDDFLANSVRHSQPARTHHFIVHQHSTCPALPEAAAKARIVHLQVVTQNIEKRTRRVHVQVVHTAIDFQGGGAHKYLTVSNYTSGIRGHMNAQLFILEGRENWELMAIVPGH